MATADFDNDGDVDIVAGMRDWNTGTYGDLKIWENTLSHSSLSFESDGNGLGNADTTLYAVCSGDLDNDGEFDDCVDATCEYCVGFDRDVVYDICLMVTDNYGETDVHCTTVTVPRYLQPLGTPASIINTGYKQPSDIVNSLILLIMPIGAVLFLRALWRKK